MASTAAALDLATPEKKKKKQKIYLRTSSKFGILQRFEERQQESTESQGAEEPNSCQSFAPVQKARSQSTLSADSSGSGSSEWRRIRTASDFSSTKSPKVSPKDCSPMEVRDYAMASSMPSYVPLPSPFLGTSMSMWDLPRLIPVSSWQPPQPPPDECLQVMFYNVPKKSKEELQNRVQAAGFPGVKVTIFPACGGCQAVRIQFASSQEANDFHEGFVSGSFTSFGHDASRIQAQLGLFCHSCGSTVGELFFHCVQCGAALHEEAAESRLSNSSEDAPCDSDDSALRSTDASSVQSDES